MAQFDVYPNPDSGQNRKIPFLLDLQSDLLSGLSSTVVAPLYDPDFADRPPVRELTPVFEVEGRQVVMMTPELAGVPVKRLPRKIGNLSMERNAIIAALDFVFTGV